MQNIPNEPVEYKRTLILIVMKSIISVLLIIILLSVINSCRKADIIATDKIDFGNTLFDSVGYRDIVIKTSLTTTGDVKIDQHGHCWSEYQNPLIKDNTTTLGEILQCIYQSCECIVEKKKKFYF